MTTELVTKDAFDLPDNVEDFLADTSMVMAMTGQQEENSSSGGLPELKINQDSEFYPDGDLTQEPITLPRGTYKLLFTRDNGTRVNVYSKTAVFRPMWHGFRYAAYVQSGDTGEYVNESSIFQSWGHPVWDTQGNELKAGEYKKTLVGAYPTLKCSHVCFGTVTMKDAATADGEKIEVESMPIMYCPKGSNYMAFEDALQSITKSKKLIINHSMTLSSHREQNGSNIYYASDYKVDKKTYELTSDEYELLKKFARSASVMNKRIQDTYTKMRDDTSAAELIKEVSGADLSADFADEIPL